MSDNRKMLGFDRAASARIVAERRATALDRIAMSEARVAAVKAASAVPPVCGPDIVPAPARRAFAVFRPMEVVPGSAGTARSSGYRGPGEAMPRSAMRAADVFDAMIDAARRRHDARGEDAGPFIAPFTPGQVQIARDYRDLTERHGSVIRCASLEAGRGGGGSGEFIDAYIAEGLRLAALVRRIGTGAALSVRRLRPSLRVAASRDISARALVDMTCLGDLSLKRILLKHGWAVSSARLSLLRQALAEALDRMQGYQ